LTGEAGEEEMRLMVALCRNRHGLVEDIRVGGLIMHVWCMALASSSSRGRLAAKYETDRSGRLIGDDRGYLRGVCVCHVSELVKSALARAGDYWAASRRCSVVLGTD
jgi:hypothetical protein